MNLTSDPYDKMQSSHTHKIFWRGRDMCEFLSNLTCSQLWWNSPFQIDRTSSSSSQSRGIISSSQMYFKHAQIVRLCTMLLNQHIVIFHRALVLICKLFKITYSHTVTEFEIESVTNFDICKETYCVILYTSKNRQPNQYFWPRLSW